MKRGKAFGMQQQPEFAHIKGAKGAQSRRTRKGERGNEDFQPFHG